MLIGLYLFGQNKRVCCTALAAGECLVAGGYCSQNISRNFLYFVHVLSASCSYPSSVELVCHMTLVMWHKVQKEEWEFVSNIVW